MDDILLQSSPKLSVENTEQPKVQVDLAGIMEGFIGRIKEKPMCVDETLKKEAMTTEELQKLAFPLETPKDSMRAVTGLQTALPPSTHIEASIVSSASSTASRESAYFSDIEGVNSSTNVSSNNGGNSTNKVVMTPLRLERRQSDINSKVTAQKISRNGRQSQRWYNDPQSQRIYRMVTGCVPIVDGGKVLFVSASRKSEWILPKGGWERDEAIEESAIRETFEEAGVLGVLGPRLGEIEYETRKAKKRRLEQQEAHKRMKMLRQTPSTDSHGTKSESENRNESDIASIAQIPADESARVQYSTAKDETSSVTSDSSASYSHVRMTLFPLYVSEVKTEWPENGRFRKAVDIDEAIRITEKRPEFQAALIQVKEKNLHLLETEVNTGRASDR